MENNETSTTVDDKIVKILRYSHLISLILFLVSLLTPYIYSRTSGIASTGLNMFLYAPVIGWLSLILPPVTAVLIYKNSLRKAIITGFIGNAALSFMFYIIIRTVFSRHESAIGLYLGFSALIGLWIASFYLYKNRDLEPTLKKMQEIKRAQKPVPGPKVYCPRCGKRVREDSIKCLDCGLDLAQNPPTTTPKEKPKKKSRGRTLMIMGVITFAINVFILRLPGALFFFVGPIMFLAGLYLYILSKIFV